MHIPYSLNINNLRRVNQRDDFTGKTLESFDLSDRGNPMAETPHVDSPPAVINQSASAYSRVAERDQKNPFGRSIKNDVDFSKRPMWEVGNLVAELRLLPLCRLSKSVYNSVPLLRSVINYLRVASRRVVVSAEQIRSMQTERADPCGLAVQLFAHRLDEPGICHARLDHASTQPRGAVKLGR